MHLRLHGNDTNGQVFEAMYSLLREMVAMECVLECADFTTRQLEHSVIQATTHQNRFVNIQTLNWMLILNRYKSKSIYLKTKM